MLEGGGLALRDMHVNDVHGRMAAMLLESSNGIDDNLTEAGVGYEAAPPQTGEAEFRAVDRRLREYARKRSALDAAEAFDLVRAEDMKLHFHVGCSSLYDYMERVLGYQPHTAHERMRVARALVQLPETAAALSQGVLSYSGARELTRVAIAETETEWLAKVKDLAADKIERLVARHKAGDWPDDPPAPDVRPRKLRLELPPEVYALWRQARVIVATQRGGEIDDADFIETLCRAAISPGSGSDGPVHQIAYQQCPDCLQATQNGAGRDIDIRPDVLEGASLDS